MKPGGQTYLGSAGGALPAFPAPDPDPDPDPDLKAVSSRLAGSLALAVVCVDMLDRIVRLYMCVCDVFCAATCH